MTSLAPGGGLRPTLNSVAREAQVSRQTVSNVLNSPHLVRPDTLQRVRRVIEQVGYRPNRVAQQMRAQRSQALGLRLEPLRDGINGVVLDRFLHALTESAQARGYRVLAFTAEDDAGELAVYQDLAGSMQVDAFVLTSTHYDDQRAAWLSAHGLPFSTFGRPWGAEDRDSYAWVDVDGAAGTGAAVRHLAELGHRRIGFLGWPSRSGIGDERRLGWRAACQQLGLPVAGLDQAVDDGVTQAHPAASALVDGEHATAIVCASDSLALGVHGWATGRGVVPGAGLAIVGFDDTPVAAALAISSIAQPIADVAAECVRLVVDPPASMPNRPAQILLPPTLVVRSSSQAPVRA